MKDESIRKSLASLARKNVPDDTNLWPHLAVRLEQKDLVAMQQKWKVAWIILLVLLGLSAVTGVAYAVYHYFNDAGLQGAQDAGLVSDLNMTAQPVTVPYGPTSDGHAHPVTFIGQGQTVNGAGVTLDWVYLDETRLVFGFSARDLPAGTSFDTPIVSFGDVTPVQEQGRVLSVNDSAGVLTGVYMSYQVINIDVIGRSQIGLGIDIPLIQENTAGDNLPLHDPVLAAFHFALQAIPVYRGPTLYFQQTYSVKLNGIQLQLDSVVVTTSSTTAHFCYEGSALDQEWNSQAVTVRFGDAHDAGIYSDPSREVHSQGHRLVDTGNGVHCAEVGFPVGSRALEANPAEPMLILAVGKPQGSRWEFSVDLLRMDAMPGLIPPTPTPSPTPATSSQTIGEETITLEKAYADAARMVFVVHLEGPRQGYSIYNAVLQDVDGNPINNGVGLNSLADDPARWNIEFTPQTEFVPGQFHGKLVFDVTALPGDGSWTVEAKFDLDMPVYPAGAYEPMQTVNANGVDILLQKVTVTPSYTQIYLCYQEPSLHDWGFGPSTTLQVGSDIVSLESYSLLFDPVSGFKAKIPDPDWTPPTQAGRCVKLGFPIGRQGWDQTMTLTIPKLEQTPPEAIPDNELQAAHQKLLAQGIDIDWIVSSGNGGGGGGTVINKKPEGMTDEQVMHLFYEALGYYYPGPWVFTIEIKP